MKSPIETMIDKACGVPGDFKPKPRVQLLCSKCGRTKLVSLDETDPPGTATVKMPCPKCFEGQFEEVNHFDAEGKELKYD